MRRCAAEAANSIGHPLGDDPTHHSAMNAQKCLTRVSVLFCLTILCSPAHSEVDRSAYRSSTIEGIVGTHGLKLGSSESTEAGTLLIAPEFKYRLRLKATGRMRELTPDAAAALSAWGKMHSDLPAFLKEYTHEIEAKVDGKPMWLLWQRSLVEPFRVERSDGGDIEVYAILAGAFQGKLLLFVTAFESI